MVPVDTAEYRHTSLRGLAPIQEQAMKSRVFAFILRENDVILQHVLSGLRLKAFRAQEDRGLPGVDYWLIYAKPYGVPSIVRRADYHDHPRVDASQIITDGGLAYDRYKELGIGTALYLRLDRVLPPTARVGAAPSSAPAIPKIRFRMHKRDPYRWESNRCSWCAENVHGGINHKEKGIPFSWSNAPRSAFSEHP